MKTRGHVTIHKLVGANFRAVLGSVPDVLSIEGGYHNSVFLSIMAKRCNSPTLNSVTSFGVRDSCYRRTT